jgi:hypothetical protein
MKILLSTYMWLHPENFCLWFRRLIKERYHKGLRDGKVLLVSFKAKYGLKLQWESIALICGHYGKL